MTETTAVGCVGTLEHWRIGTVGRPMPGVEVRIAEDGEIQMRGPNIFKEYWRNPEATAETFSEDGWLMTGDLGALDDDGYLSITGRKKDIIITAGGKNLAPANVENDLKQSRWISQAVMFGDRKPYPVALITLDPEELVPWAREHGLPEDVTALGEHETVRALIQDELDRVNAKYARVEQVKRFAILRATSPRSRGAHADAQGQAQRRLRAPRRGLRGALPLAGAAPRDSVPRHRAWSGVLTGQGAVLNAARRAEPYDRRMRKRALVLALAVGSLVLVSCSGNNDPVTNVTATSATFNAHGTCDSGQPNPCEWRWRYRKVGDSAWTETPLQGPVTGSASNVPLKWDVSGLTPGTNYEEQIGGRGDDVSTISWTSSTVKFTTAAATNTVFSDGFESGDFANWSQVQTAGDGAAVVQSAVVKTGAAAAQLSESATAGSKAYIRKTLSSAQQELTVSGAFRVASAPGERRQRPLLPPAGPGVGARRQPLPPERLGRHDRPGLRRHERQHHRQARPGHVGDPRAARHHRGREQHGRREAQRASVYTTTTASLGTAGRADAPGRQRHRRPGLRPGGRRHRRRGRGLGHALRAGERDAADDLGDRAGRPDADRATTAPGPGRSRSPTPTSGSAATAPAPRARRSAARRRRRTRRPRPTSAARCAWWSPRTTRSARRARRPTRPRVVQRRVDPAVEHRAADDHRLAAAGADADAPSPAAGTAASRSPTPTPGSAATARAPLRRRSRAPRRRRYLIAAADVGKTLRVAVKATNGSGNATATSAATAVVQATQTQPGLVALWHMDETSGTTMADAVGGHTGTLHSVTLGQPGFARQGLRLQRQLELRLGPDGADLNPGASTITVTIRLKTTSAPASPDWDLIRKGLYTTRRRRVEDGVPADRPGLVRLQRLPSYSEMTAGPGHQRRPVAHGPVRQDLVGDQGRRGRDRVLAGRDDRDDLQHRRASRSARAPARSSSPARSTRPASRSASGRPAGAPRHPRRRSPAGLGCGMDEPRGVTRRTALRTAAGAGVALAAASGGALPAWARPVLAAGRLRARGRGRSRGCPRATETLPADRPHRGRDDGEPLLRQHPRDAAAAGRGREVDGLRSPARAARWTPTPTRRASRVPASHAPTVCQDHGEPSQAWNASHISYDGGRNDGFVRASGPRRDALLRRRPTCRSPTRWPGASRSASATSARAWPRRTRTSATC